MSLDVMLRMKGAEKPKGVGSGISVREDGGRKEISRAEWDARNPGREPVVFVAEDDETCDFTEVYSSTITHNLNKMAMEAGIYEHLWRPDEIGISTASQLIEPLAAGYQRLLADPEKFKEFNPANGWGTYDGLVAFVRDYIKACLDYPEATVVADR